MADVLQPSDDAVATAITVAAHISAFYPMDLGKEEGAKKRVKMIGEMAEIMLDAVNYQSHFSKRS